MEVSRVSVTDIDMRFWSMVSFMVKWAFATIFALLIIALLITAFGGGAVLIGMWLLGKSISI